jgi:hypothetical protein
LGRSGDSRTVIHGEGSRGNFFQLFPHTYILNARQISPVARQCGLFSQLVHGAFAKVSVRQTIGSPLIAPEIYPGSLDPAQLDVPGASQNWPRLILFRIAVTSLRRQPQDRVWPYTTLLRETVVSRPHEHSQCQRIFELRRTPSSAMTSSLPNRLPVRSMNRIPWRTIAQRSADRRAEF